MTFHVPTLSTRARRTIAASSIGLLAGALAVSPATAAPGCDTFAATGEDYEAELACASDATEGEQVITLTDSFTVDPNAYNVYTGTQPLTITAEPGVVVTGADAPPEGDFLQGSFLVVPPLNVPGPTLSPQAIEEPEQPLELDALDTQIQALEQEAAPLAAAAAAEAPASITIENVTVRGFQTFGAVSVLNDTPLHIIGSTFEDNGPELDLNSEPAFEAFFLATVSGAGEIVVEDSTFTGNEGAYGAGVSNLVSQLVTEDVETAVFPTITVTDSAFEGNTGLIGSAVLSIGSADVTRSTFTDNAGQLGSAIVAAESLALADSTIARNDSRPQNDDAAEIYADGGAVAVIGGFEGAAGSIEVTNSTFADNISPVGTLLVPIADSISIESSTFSGNAVVEPEGGDLVVEEHESATISGTVFSSDQATACATLSEAADVIETSYVFDDGSCTNGWSGEGDLGEGLDAQLGALADNGGATATALPAASSPLIDAIPADALVTQVDQRGIARPQGDAGDIGAVEVADAGDLVEFQVKTDAGTILGTATPAIDVTGIQWIPVADLDTAPPADTMFPYGAAAFSVQVPQAGDSVTITLTAPRPFTTALKSGDEWTEISGATYSQDRTTVTYTLTDGGELDEDGTANGVIVDPIALAVQGTFTG